MVSVRQKLEQRAASTNDEGFHEIFSEVDSNWDSYSQELEEPTLKHGTDTANFEDIVEEGLVPGENNNSETGESSNHEDVCFSTSYPIALRYSELTEANNYLRDTELNEIEIGNIDSPMVVEIPVRSLDSVKVDSRNEGAITEVLGVEVSGHQASMISKFCEQDSEDKYSLSEFIDYEEEGLISEVENGNKKAQKIAYSLLNTEPIDPEDLIEKSVFSHIDHNELEASFLKEVRADYGSGEDMVIYVPQNELEEYRQKVEEESWDVDLGSLEGRALVHEARMEKEYEDGGCVDYTRPEDGKYGVNVFDPDEERVPHDASQGVIQISRLDGEPIYLPK